MRLMGARPLDDRAEPRQRRWVEGYFVVDRTNGALVRREAFDLGRLDARRRIRLTSWYHAWLTLRFRPDRYSVQAVTYGSAETYDRHRSFPEHW